MTNKTNSFNFFNSEKPRLVKNDEKANKMWNNGEASQNVSAQDLHEIIKSGNFPSFLTQSQKSRIKDLYESGKQWDGVRALKSLIEDQNAPKKTLL